MTSSSRGMGITVASVFAAVLSGIAMAGPEMKISDDSFIKLSFLGQVNYQYNEDNVDKADFFLRRGRIIIDGQIMDGVKFFADTDNPNDGKNTDPATSTYIQDAFMEVRISGTHSLQAGLILLPFSFETRASATSLLGIDYNSECIKLVNTHVWRDYGLELNGSFLDTVGYRIGVFDGFDKYSTSAMEKNPSAPLRVTGHVAVNLLGSVDNGWFFTQNGLGKKTFVAIGAGYDRQNNATSAVSTNPAIAGTLKDAEAWVIDYQSAFAFGDKTNPCCSLLVNAAYYKWDNASFKGNTYFVEGGLMIRKFMPTFKCSVQDADEKSSVTDYTIGLNYFLKGQNARGGIEYRWGDSASQTLIGLQVLL